MKATEVRRAVAAGMSTASALDLRVDDAVVLHDSNRLTLRLRPCDVLARVEPLEGGDVRSSKSRLLVGSPKPMAP